jgi:hypothetical protein
MAAETAPTAPPPAAARDAGASEKAALPRPVPRRAVPKKPAAIVEKPAADEFR